MDPTLVAKLERLPLREREIALQLGNVPCIRDFVFPGLGTEPHDGDARAVLGHLATVLDLFQNHPLAKEVPFDVKGSEHKEMPYFLLGAHYVVRYFIVVMTTAEGWGCVYHTPIVNQVEQMKTERSIIVVGEWARTDLCWLATTKSSRVDFRRPRAFPGSKDLKGDDLLVPWITWSTSGQPNDV